MDSKEQQVKPPLGIEPEWIWKQKRCFELVRAIARYDAANRCVDESWFLELGKLIPKTFPARLQTPTEKDPKEELDKFLKVFPK